jgi:ATP-dependent DNA helicase PIF1
MAKKKSFFAVRKGRNEGIFLTWDECSASVTGYPGAEFKGFKTMGEAEAFIGEDDDVHVPDHEPVNTRQRTDEPPLFWEDRGCSDWASAAAEESSKDVDLSKCDANQAAVVRAAQEGHNIFMTGMAGTGKSFTLTKVIEALKIKYGDNRVAVLAPTGIAALAHTSGQTLHSFVGAGVPNSTQAFEKVWGRKKRWRQVSAIVIDEIGMVNAEYFDYVEAAVRKVRVDPHRAFGGLQVVLCGDFLQIGPVEGTEELADKDASKLLIGDDGATLKPGAGLPVGMLDCCGYCFQSAAWRSLQLHNFNLTAVYRQTDFAFIGALAELRRGEGGGPSVAALLDRVGGSQQRAAAADGIRPTVLHCTNRYVDAENKTELDKLGGEEHKFACTDTITIAQGAPPWAVETLKEVAEAMGNAAPSTLVLKVGAQVMLTKNHMDSKLVNGSRGVVVAFTPAGPEVQFVDEVTLVCEPEAFDKEVYQVGAVQRMQVPLKLAWAATIHKTQGMSLDRVEANLSKAFCDGQVYVALSRCRTAEGLTVSHYSAAHVIASPLALEFHDAVSRDDTSDFLSTEKKCPLWFRAALRDPVWRPLFLQNGDVREWAMRFPLT